jgi:CheY-like chemotaxis protein
MKTKATPLSVISELKSVLLIDNNDIDNFVNSKILENYGVTTIMSCRSIKSALNHLKETDIKYQLILVDIYLPMIDGFEFIDVIRSLNLHKKHGEICILSASLNPLHKQKSIESNVRFIEKPLTIEQISYIKTANYK